MPQERLRPTKLSDVEASICLRMADVRCLLSLDQKTFGEFVMLSRDRISSYENLRAPLRYSVADQLCQTFRINQRFLATGKRPQFFYVSIPQELAAKIQPRDLFSTAYINVIGEHVERAIYDEAEKRGCSQRDLSEARVPDADTIARLYSTEGSLRSLDVLAPLLAEVVRKGYDSVSHQLRWKYYKAISDAVSDFLHRNPPGQGLK